MKSPSQSPLPTRKGAGRSGRWGAGGPGLLRIFFRSFEPQFSLKIRNKGVGAGPSPGYATGSFMAQSFPSVSIPPGICHFVLEKLQMPHGGA